MHESRFGEEPLNLSIASRYPYGLFLLLSFLLHLTLLLLIRGWNFEKPSLPEKPDTFVELVDPPASQKRETVLFGTDSLADLEAIPKGKETRLPPIPRSAGPAVPPGPGGIPRGGGGSGSSPGARIQPALPPVFPGPPVQSLEPDRSAGSTDLPTLPGPGEGDLPLPSLPFEEGGNVGVPGVPGLPGGSGGSGGSGGGGGSGEPGGFSLPGGFSGLPFADSKSLDRLAKVFSDKEQAPSKDAVSINTDQLKYFSYMLKVKNKIEYIWKYPAAAAARQIEGDLLLNFTIHRDGRISDIAVVSSSGHDVLDREAVRALTAASPFAPLPDAWNEDRLTITGHFLYFNQINYIR